MELELGLKITKTKDDISSISEIWLAKDRAGPVFLSRETNTMFILTAHLKGYKRNNIDIKINEDGSKISISGEKPIQEMLMMGWVVFKKEVEITGFNKVFKIPDGVILDRIKAKYDEEEWTLKIVMPKLVKGICGARIEEVKEEEFDRARSELEKSEADHILSSIGETSQEGSKESKVQEMEYIESVMEKKEGGVHEKVLDDAHGDIIGEPNKKEIEESEFGTEDKDGESVREKVGKAGFEAMMTPELGQIMGEHIPQNFGDTSKEVIQQMGEAESSVEKMKRGEYEKRVVKATESTEEDTCGEAKQKEFEEPKFETRDRDKGRVKEEISLERFGEKKKLKLDQTVADHIPSNIGAISQEESKESGIQQMEKTESVAGKMDGGESEGMLVEANKITQKNIFGETILKDIEKPKIETDVRDQECVREEADKEGFQAMKTVREEFPEQLSKAPVEESEGPNILKLQETKEVKEAMVKRKGAEIECLVEKSEGEEPQRMHVKANSHIQKDITKETKKEKIEKPENGTKDGDQQNVQVGEMLVEGSKGIKVPKMEEPKEVIKEAMTETESSMEKAVGEESKKITEEASRAIEKNRISKTFKKEVLGAVQEKLPKQVVEAMAQKENDEIECAIVKSNGEGSKKMHIEANEIFKEGTTGDRIEKEIREPKFRLTFSDQLSGQEDVDNGRFDKANSRKEFPKEVADFLFDGSKRLKFSEKGETRDFKEETAEIEQSFKKVKGEKYEKIRVKAHGDFRKDITRETTSKETDEHKIQTEEKDQQCLQEELSKGRFEARKVAKEEFPMQIVDSLANERKGPKDTKKEEAKEVKEEVVKQKIEETKVLADVEYTTKEKALELGTPERELQSTKGLTTSPKEVSMRFKEIEQESAKDKMQKKELQHPKIQSKETCESENESVNQDILKPKTAKDVEEGVAPTEYQVAKPLSAPSFPLTQQSEVKERDKLYEGCKAKYEASPESQRNDSTMDFQNSIEMKENREYKQPENLLPEIPLEEHLDREQFIKQDAFHKGQKVEETIQEEIKEPKKKISDRDQQNAQRDVGKGVGIVETTRKEMPKEDYVANGGPTVGRMETKRDLEAALEREKYITTQNVLDEKPEIKEEIKKADIEQVDKVKWAAESMETTQEKEHTRKSKEVVKREAEPPEAISSYPRVTSMGIKEAGPKSEIEELHQKELPPLTVEMKSKEPLELEKPIMEWKFPKTKERVLEQRDKEQYGDGTEDIKAPKIAAYQRSKQSKVQSPPLTQQSIDEGKGKSDNVVDAKHEAPKESPKKITKIDLRDSNEWMTPLENEEMESLQPHILATQCLEEEPKGPKIVIEDRGQQYVQEDNDKKRYETTKAIEEELTTKAIEEELLEREQTAETVIEKREGPTVAKRGETKEASKQLLKRDGGKTTQTAKDKKPIMKEITPEFAKADGFKQVAERMHETQEREHHKELEIVTPKMGVEPLTAIVVPLKSASKQLKEVKLNNGIEKSQTEEMSPLPMEIQRKDPQELSSPSMKQEIPKIEGVQQEKEGEKPIHALEAAPSKREELAQATATHSKAKGSVEPKGEIDKPQTNQLSSPSMAMLSQEPHELDKFSMKKDDSKVESLPQVREGKESIHSREGTKESKVVAEKVAKPSKISIPSSTQQFEVEEKEKQDVSHEVGNQESQRDSKIDVQESKRSKSYREVEQMETSETQFPTDQLFLKKGYEEFQGKCEIEEEKTNEQGVETRKDDSQELEKQKECKVEAGGGKKDDTRRSKKLWAPLVIAGSAIGSAILVSLIVFFVRQRRARNRSTK